MITATRLRERAPGRRVPRGFTVIEALIVVVIMMTVVGAMMPSMAKQVSRARVNRAVNTVAADFLMAQAMAGRQHQPVTVTFDASAKTATLSSRGTTLVTRQFGSGSEYKLTGLSASAASVVILPSGMANQSVTVTVSGGGYSRQARLTRAGQVRLL
jgi:type II secretory pathway pseudopilin PulG